MNAQKYAGALWPFALILLTGIYGYWAVQRELVSSRPSVPGQYDVPDPIPPLGVHSIHSRLWQDPFCTAYEHWKGLPQEERAPHLTSVSDSEELTNTVQNAAMSSNPRGSDTGSDNLTPTLDEKSIAEYAEALHKVFWCCSDGADKDDHVVNREENMRMFFRSLVDKEATVCMPVLLPGGPYAEDKEKRMRIRYAVVTALAESGYSLTYSTRMSYVVVKIQIRVLRGWQEREIVVPFKLYRLPGRPQVLVLWINEAELEQRPLLALHRILNAIFSDVTGTEHLSVSIIGPATSGVLSEMTGDIGPINDAFFPKVIHEAIAFNNENDKAASGEHDAIEKAVAKINEHRKTIITAACADRIPHAEQIREKAAVIANTRSFGYIRKLTKDIKEATGENPDAAAFEIRNSADKIDLLIDKIKRKSEVLVERAGRTIGDAARSIAEEIGTNADTSATESIKTEANILSESSSDTWQTVVKINKMAKDLSNLEAEQRQAWAREIKLAAAKVELAEDLRDSKRSDSGRHRVKSEAVTVIQRAVAIIKEKAEAVEDGATKKTDLAKTEIEISEQIDRIRIAQAYMMQQAANRIALEATSVFTKAENKRDVRAKQVEALEDRSNEIKTAAYDIIKHLGGHIAPNEESFYWCVATC